MTTTYDTGTISVDAGSTIVTGSGTGWIAAGILAGDDFRAAGLTVEIASVDSATQITLARAWPGAGLTAVDYSIRLIDAGERSLTALNQIVTDLGSGNLTSLAGLTGAANKLPYFTGVGTFALADITAAARALLARATIEQTSSTDATEGRVLRNFAAGGSFGLGNLGTGNTLANLDAFDNPAGFYRTTDTTTGTFPTFNGGTAVGKFGHLTEERYSANTVRQTYQVINGATGGGRVFVRTGSDPTWGAWIEQVSLANVLGTVSQSAGVPNGAIFEKPTNTANGWFRKTADGWMQCWQTMAADAAGAATWPFPGGAFVEVPVVGGVSLNSTARSFTLDPGLLTTTAVGFSSYNVGGSRTAAVTYLTAVGRWSALT